MSKKKIVIIGNGFASLFFIQYFLLSPIYPFFAWFVRRIYSKYEITLIGNGEFIYFPSIPEFITGKKTKKDICVDIKPFLKRRNIKFINEYVIDIKDGGRTVVTKESSYTNDVLFLGIGPAFLKNDIAGTKEHTLSPCDGPDSMLLFLEKLYALNSGIVYLGFKVNSKDGFVSGRGGQMYECACLLDFALKEKGIRDNFEIHFFSPNIKVGEKGMITDRLQERGIILDYGYEPVAFLAEGLKDADGTVRPADLVLYSPGISGTDLVNNSCLPVSKGGQIEADKYGQVIGLDNVYVSGDCANHEEPPPWVPHQAHMAQLRSEAVAKNVKAKLKGLEPSATYRYELSCIMNMENDAIWLHMSSDGKPPFWNIFPKHSKSLMSVKTIFEKLYLVYLRYM